MSGAPATLETVDLQQILKLLPHRYPFLMVDRIVDINGTESAIGIKNVTANEPHFQGHFPDQPIMPGVLILEGMAQTAGAVSIRSFDADAPKLVYLMTIEEARFRKPVVPGDVLEYHVQRVRARGYVWKFACEAIVGGAKVAEAMITAMMNDPEK
ncbi:MAG TPA: 3-hydroxyacyl-ACP dehydratase FabZ [Bauldia sp.]|nr:3-hydroxyacyl-ACP dehydratase FabZ [Bauldia sp.]